MNVIELLGQTTQLKEWSSDLINKQQILVTGLAGSAKVMSVASIFKEKQQSILFIAPNLYHASNIADDMAHILSEDEFYLFPVNDVMSAEMAIASPDAMSDRVEFITALQNNHKAIYIVPLAGIRKFLPAPEIWRSFSRSITLGDEVELDELIQHLILMGYTREQMVEKPGEFSLRGSILDVYPLTLPYPVRIDFFDIEIDSIRYFDFASQRSIENLETVELSPVTDTFNSRENLLKSAKKLKKSLDKHLNVVHSEEENDEVEIYFNEIIDSWEKGQLTETTRYYPDFLYQEKYTLLDYFPKDGFVFVDDYSRIQEAEQELLREEAEWMTIKLEDRQLFEEQVMGEDFRDTLKRIKQPTTFFSVFQKGMGNLKFHSVYQFMYRSMQQFFGQMPLFKVETARWQKNKCTVILLVPNEERALKLEEMLIDFDIPRIITQSDDIVEQQIQIVEGELQSGFELPTEKLVVVTEREIFNISTKKRAKKRTLSNAERLKDYTELQPGDFVVHANHGIGKYIGMETLLVDGIHQDYLSILYQKDDKLFIPVTQLNLIQKYMPSETKSPKVSKLGGNEWTKTKSKVSSRVEDIADELLELYAKRESEQGFAFSPDDMLQKAFEDAFPYPETDDQIRSVAEIKHDMEKIRPMDRLLVGDVGFGKTEVALRAAFKAVQDNKQVAFLVPTTILAQQHYDTMMARFEDFPVRVGLLSRFRTKKQQEETINQLRKGEIDIVVGTHRVLSKDIEFQDLGLLIIDEEQRFGVKHKERLKSLRSQVDVLTLTATPIPRTLHMSMLGIRDLSVIETPPANRYPIQTYVMEKNPGAIREAIERELARDGQVFYLYNRIDTIHQKADELQFLVPEARIGIAHGRLTEIQLENILFEFINGDYDILVTTTIIETGVDIPNANTLFVEDADHMGLSQLYQLRGRVGRTNRVAYAYFMYAQQKVLNEVSEKRLQAIKDFTELGAGFKIAMRDLSIRGAGSMLGSQQHGFIDSVGFDMYAQMLSDAIARKRGVEQVQKTSTEINLGLDAYIPGTYIEDERQKIEIYKRIRQLESVEMYEEVKEDLFDRFGEYPTEVENLLYVGIIKMYSDSALIDSIQKKNRHIVITMSKMANQVYETMQLFKAVSLANKDYKVDIQTVHDQFEITLMLPVSVPTDVWLDEVLNLVQGLNQQKYESAKQESGASL